MSVLVSPIMAGGAPSVTPGEPRPVELSRIPVASGPPRLRRRWRRPAVRTGTARGTRREHPRVLREETTV
ncbi:hypothetical protein [Streptomyces sp. NBC_00872]|uniref:hypothetical protein n=1 Tax=Streptomyces sp. NBC_00872 TaxID=2903686 RepID=UPI003867D298|nr:hypothetical protein OG214_03765 [Streptomyces sp. NBC_00872]